eukprot:2971225-Prymnesium_polylepis.6
MQFQDSVVRVDHSLEMADPKKALKLCVKAISENDTNSLYSAMESTQLPFRAAVNVSQQAWRRDVGADCIGAAIGDGGMLHAVYLGVAAAQQRAGLGDHGADNATTLLASLAIDLDDPRLVDVIVSWDKNFRVGEKDEDASVDSTVEFFCNTGAPKCAARFMELKNELVLAPRNQFLEDATRARIVRNAKTLSQKGGLHPLVKACMEQLCENEGHVPVIDHQGDDGKFCVFSVGLSLTGRSEVIAICSAKKLRKTHAKLNKLVTEAMRGDIKELPSLDRYIRLGGSHVLVLLGNATTHLRPAEVPAVVFA